MKEFAGSLIHSFKKEENVVHIQILSKLSQKPKRIEIDATHQNKLKSNFENSRVMFPSIYKYMEVIIDKCQSGNLSCCIIQSISIPDSSGCHIH